MKSRMTKAAGLMALVLSLVFFVQSTSSQSANNCLSVVGRFSDVTSGGSTTGTVVNGGILNGTSETVFTPGFIFTADPTTISLTGDYTLTTNRGAVKTHNVYIFDFANRLGSAIYRIDPSQSTGIFAGASGALYANGKAVDPVTVEGDIRGEICFASQ